jgi:hypothetical protein
MTNNVVLLDLGAAGARAAGAAPTVPLVVFPARVRRHDRLGLADISLLGPHPAG